MSYYLPSLDEFIQKNLREKRNNDVACPNLAADNDFSSCRFSVTSDVMDMEDEYDRNNVGSHIRKFSTGILRVNLSFSTRLQQLMIEKNISAPELYKRSQVDKTTFSKITNDLNYNVSKETAICLSFGMRLSLDEANDLLERAGYSLSHSILRDVILEYCFLNGICDLITVNEILNSYNMKILGRM